MKRLRALLVTTATVVGSTVALTAPAAATTPVGGCPGGYELRTVVSLQQEAVQAPPSFFTGIDVNADGFLCNKYLPEPAINTGLVVDNKQKIKG